MLRCTVTLAEGFYALHDQVSFWQETKILGQECFQVIDCGCRIVDISLTTFIGIWIVIPLTGSDLFEEGLQVSLEFHFVHDAEHLFSQPGNLVEANRMNFVSA